MSLKGGKDITEAVKRMMGDLMINDVVLKLTYFGTKDKVKFGKLKILDIIKIS